jgi:response regulator RpfG family c-di-GMP phosphodiesterase
MRETLNFILVDDDPLNNSICKHVIKAAIDATDIRDFIYPEEALEFLQKHPDTIKDNTILLLDINMPRVNAWEFLKVYDTFDERLRNKITLYILSSSLNENDMEKARTNPHVKEYITKPLSKEAVLQIAETPSGK